MRYVCQICGYVYDDSKEKVPFEQLPETWKCPLCGAAKSDFKLEVQPAENKAVENKSQEIKLTENGAEKNKSPKIKPSGSEQESAELDTELAELSVGQLAALCSNLARGCEKQYNEEASELFKELAGYFAKITPEVNDPSVEKLAADLQRDVDQYAGIRATADTASDRGAARICVWGEKVTRMLSSLVNRYLKEGEEMLASTNIWVCTICGFVYIGDEAPQLCPVCKVPDWKFEKIEGRA